MSTLKVGVHSALGRALISIGFILAGVVSAQAQPALPPAESPVPTTENSLDLDPETIENSPVLQRWLDEVPDVRSRIRSDPSFRTRLRLIYSQYPASEQAAGVLIGVEDVFLGRSPLTVSAQYQTAFDRPIESYGADLHYYVLPLGSYVNLAPTVGYRHIEAIGETTDGVNVGLRLMLALSRTGAADIVVSQSWVAPGSDSEVGLTTVSVGYAVTPNLRLSADVQQQNAPQRKDSRVGIGLEWMP
ncbi:hypothetical protein [Leptolyngbya ohadii]|uniref:hypothetical protein n=1 Tax=Leptolyngbya ohadii TaxID=1962290 RepID=UPI00117B47D3|nr:hypothetical protein [Leptolyngbya ohadii]